MKTKVAHYQQLVTIRDRWHDFSMEATNPKPAREAAWKFSQELRTVLKIYFDRKAGEAGATGVRL